MIITWLFAFGLYPTPAHSAPLTLKPTRLEWCSALLDVRDRAPAETARVLALVDQARARLDATLSEREPESARPRREKPVRPHFGRVVANMRRGPLDADHFRALRKSRGRLAALSLDFENPDPDFPPLARIDVGRHAVAAALESVMEEAKRRTAEIGPKPNADYYVRSVGNVAALGTLTGAFALATEHYVVDPNRNAFGLFLGATIFSAASLWDTVRYHQRHLATEAGRISLENRYNRDRVNVEPEAVERLRRLADAPTPDLFAHDGYSLYLPAASLQDLRAREAEPAVVNTRYSKLRRQKCALFVDLVLFANAEGEPTLLTTVRARPTARVPITWAALRFVGDI